MSFCSTFSRPSFATEFHYTSCYRPALASIGNNLLLSTGTYLSIRNGSTMPILSLLERRLTSDRRKRSRKKRRERRQPCPGHLLSINTHLKLRWQVVCVTSLRKPSSRKAHVTHLLRSGLTNICRRLSSFPKLPTRNPTFSQRTRNQHFHSSSKQSVSRRNKRTVLSRLSHNLRS